MCRENWILPKKSISEAEEVLTLTQLVQEHAREFPLSVVLIRGLENRVLPKTIIDIHFLKLTKASPFFVVLLRRSECVMNASSILFLVANNYRKACLLMIAQIC